MSYRNATIVLRLAGITLTAIGLNVSLVLVFIAWYLGPESSPPNLQVALISFLFPLGMFAFTLLAKPLASIAICGDIGGAPASEVTDSLQSGSVN